MVGIVVVVIVIGNMIFLKLVDVVFVVVVKFVEVMEEVGLLNGVFNYISGDGVEIGDFLVEYLKIWFVLFIGFCVVGCWIYEYVVKVQSG